MGKRSNFERIPRDFYPTPFAAVPPLIPHLRGVRTFAEPCCGDGALVRHLESFGLRCVYAGDIATGQDALALDTYGDADAIITNPPYTRPLMHALIAHFARILPTWLLLETDWASTKQAAPFMPIVHRHRVGRPPALDRRDDDDRQAELRLVSLRRSPLGRPDLSCARVGAGVVARQPVRAMRQGVSAAAIRLQVLLGHLSATRPSRTTSRDTSVTEASAPTASHSDRLYRVTVALRWLRRNGTSGIGG